MNNNGHRDKIKDYSIKVWHTNYNESDCFELGNIFLHKWYKIVNITKTRFQSLIEDQIIKMPVPVVPLGNTGRAMLVDERIPKDWYTDLCRVCFPKEMEDALLNGELSNESKE